jgi:hypothetical protein
MASGADRYRYAPDGEELAANSSEVVSRAPRSVASSMMGSRLSRLER